MFGFKSKKDKRIEELERLLYIRQPQLLKVEHNIRVLGASIILEPDMPVEYAKEMLARKMVEEVKESMSYDLEDDGRGNKLMRAYLKVAEVR